MKIHNTHHHGRVKARERYAAGGGVGNPNTKKGSGPFPGQSEKDFYETEDSAKRFLRTHGNPPISMHDSDTRDIDAANVQADPEHKDYGGY